MIQKTFTRKGPKFIEDWEHFINFRDTPIINNMKTRMLKTSLNEDEKQEITYHNIQEPPPHIFNLTVNRYYSVPDPWYTVYKLMGGDALFYINDTHYFFIRIYNSLNQQVWYRAYENPNSTTAPPAYETIPNLELDTYKISTWVGSSRNRSWYLKNRDLITVTKERYHKKYYFSFMRQTKIDLIPSGFKAKLDVIINDQIIQSVQSSNVGQMISINYNFGIEEGVEHVLKVTSLEYEIINDFDILMYSESNIQTAENVVPIFTEDDIEQNLKLAHINCHNCTLWWVQNKEWLQEYVKENTLQCSECNNYNITATMLDPEVRYVIDNPNSIIDDFYRVLVTVYSQLDTENPIPLAIIEAKFIADEIIGMGPLTVNFENESHSSFDTFLWNFGDPDSGANNTSSLENPSHTFSNIGDYDITLTASNVTNSDTKVLYNYIRVTAIIPAPIAGIFATPLIGVKPLTISLGSTSTGYIDTFEWDFNDGRTSHYENPPNIIYNFSGSYNVSLTVTGPGGVDTATTIIEVSPADEPISDFQIIGDYTGEIPLSVEFSNLSIGLIDTFHWVFGDGDNSDEENPIHIYENIGTYSVSLTVIGPGGINIKTLTDCITVIS